MANIPVNIINVLILVYNFSLAYLKNEINQWTI